jgi:glycerophosphoryl diester phosphodiesterase
MLNPLRTTLLAATLFMTGSVTAPKSPYLGLMQAAWSNAHSHGATARPVLSPLDATVLSGEVPLAALHAEGFRVVSWTTNDPEKMRQLIGMGVDGLISDRPDLLRKVVDELRAAATTPAERERLAKLNLSGHRGGRGLRPENTLPAFEAGMDQLIDTIETDTGVTTDHVSLIWHDQFLNPQSCRRADGKPYTLADRVYIRDISSTDAQATFICDKLHFGPDQKNDLSLSPVAVAFAKHEHLISPYVPTYAEQLFRFAAFYAEYYRSGPGKTHPEAKERAAHAERVNFNLETKILPEHLPAAMTANPAIPPEMMKNHTVDPQTFVDTLCGAIVRNHMQARADVQSFDFRTLRLVEQQHPDIPTYYLTEGEGTLSTEFVPAELRQPPTVTHTP